MPVVMTQTPPATWRIASLSVGPSNVTGCFTAAFMIDFSGRPHSNEPDASQLRA
jgi:hypothetical protein